MIYVMRSRFFPLLFLSFLLAACSLGGSSNSGSANANGSKPAALTTQAAMPTQLPATTAADACPSSLRRVSTCLTPHAMRIDYGVESLIQKGFTGKGQTVIDIVSFGSPTLQKDMSTFDQAFGLPAINLQIISPLNEPEQDPRHDKGGWAQETELDVQIIHALAPDAKVVVLVSPVDETEGTIGLPEFRKLEQYAIDNKLGNIVSQSWGASELTLQDTTGQQELQKWNTLYQTATTQQGMTYLASSGDGGATDYADVNMTKMSSVPTTSFSADSPWVTSVGGTALNRTDTTLQEAAWSGSGGGFSRFYQIPSYQQTLPSSVQKQFNSHRGVPDVSAVADPNTGMAIYLDGQWTLAGGTSASSPVWGALMAIANQMAGHPLGFINPGLYKLAASSTYTQDFHDVTSGNNTNSEVRVKGYSAVAGWDAVTGLGTPNAEKLLPDLISALK